MAPAFLPAAGPVAGIWFAVVVGWAWLAATSARLYRAFNSVRDSPAKAASPS